MEKLNLKSINGLVKLVKDNWKNTDSLKNCYINVDGWGICQSNVITEYRNYIVFNTQQLESLFKNKSEVKSIKILEFFNSKL